MDTGLLIVAEESGNKQEFLTKEIVVDVVVVLEVFFTAIK